MVAHKHEGRAISPTCGRSSTSRVEMMFAILRTGAIVAALCLLGVRTMAADGLIAIRGTHGPQETMNRLEAQMKAKA